MLHNTTQIIILSFFNAFSELNLARKIVIDHLSQIWWHDVWLKKAMSSKKQSHQPSFWSEHDPAC